MNNPGRYLTLLPPINGADAVSGSPYFTANPGDKAHMWDANVNLQWMPKQYITWWMEVGYRHSDVPYWTGRGGITPPGGNTGSPESIRLCSGWFGGHERSRDGVRELRRTWQCVVPRFSARSSDHQRRRHGEVLIHSINAFIASAIDDAKGPHDASNPSKRWDTISDL